MKPFNLEEYLANPSRNIVTRDGRRVRIICTDAKGNNLPIVALIEDENNVDEVCTFTKDGIWSSLGEESTLDLFLTEKREGWINLYRPKTSSQYIASSLYDSEENARVLGRNVDGYVTTIKIEWEE